MHYFKVESPLGTLHAAIADENLCVLSFTKLDEAVFSYLPLSESALAQELQKQLNAYFSKKLRDFQIPLKPTGTPFQETVWRLLQTIPYGKTCSYLEMSKNYGDVKSIRAIASANGKNPIAMLIPCHRVIGSSGDLVGYAGELWRKKELLALENSMVQQSLF